MAKEKLVVRKGNIIECHGTKFRVREILTDYEAVTCYTSGGSGPFYFKIAEISRIVS